MTTTRQWTGRENPNELNAPGNWEPYGAPRPGDDLVFGALAIASVPGGIIEGEQGSVTMTRDFVAKKFNIGCLEDAWL